MKAEGHRAITREAIKALPPKTRQWLEPEAELLSGVYCEFPDMNWPWYGEWGGEPGHPNQDRLPDMRREWNISYYCGWDPLRDEGVLYPPGKDALPPACPPPSRWPSQELSQSRFCPMGAYWAPGYYVERIVTAIQEGKFADGMRFLGVLLHHVEDRGAFAYWPDLHKKGNLQDLEALHIEGYAPLSLGETVAEVAANLELRMREMIKFGERKVDLLKNSYDAENAEAVERIVFEFHQEACRAAADTIESVAHLVDCEHSANYWGYWLEFPNAGNPTMLNLVDNPSFERDDGSGHPDGWVVGWHNLKDKLGQATWDWSRKHSVFSKVVRSGERSLKLMWTPREGIEWRQRWPVAIEARPGEKYRCSGWMKTQDATGETYLAVYLYKRGNKLCETIKGAVVSGTVDWRQLSFEVLVPEGVEKIRLACRSDGNAGAAWFDDVEIIRYE